MWFILIIFLIAFLVTLFVTPAVIKLAKKAGMMGRDINKENKPEVAELGGIGIAAGIVTAILFAVAVFSFITLQQFLGVTANAQSVTVLLAVLVALLIVEIIGFVDDVLGLKHYVKLLLPVVAAVPLIVVKIAALHYLTLPLLGELTFINPLLYTLILVPIGMTAATNVTNTFGGFNGVESSLAAIAAAALLVIGAIQGNTMVMVLSAAMLGALIAFLKYNWYPSKIFPDDVGSLLIGATIGSISIIGGIELAGAILLAPQIIDFLFFKVPNRLPSTGWWPKVKNKRLYFSGKSVHIGQWLVKTIGGRKGITERDLVLVFIAIEIVIAAIAISIYAI